MAMPSWLQRSIVAVVAASCVQLLANWSVCAFYVGPRLLEATLNRPNQPIPGPGSCDGAGEKAFAGLSALLATLVSLAAQPPKGP